MAFVPKRTGNFPFLAAVRMPFRTLECQPMRPHFVSGRKGQRHALQRRAGKMRPSKTVVSDCMTPDPQPIPPEKPLASDCCEGGCDRCVFDLYAEALGQYEVALAAWRARHREAAADGVSPP